MRRPWRRCAACGGACHWHLDAWVCDSARDGCGSEWYSDHDPKYAAPGNTPRDDHAHWASVCICGMNEQERTGHHPEHAAWCEVPSPLDEDDDA